MCNTHATYEVRDEGRSTLTDTLDRVEHVHLLLHVDLVEGVGEGAQEATPPHPVAARRGQGRYTPVSEV